MPAKGKRKEERLHRSNQPGHRQKNHKCPPTSTINKMPLDYQKVHVIRPNKLPRSTLKQPNKHLCPTVNGDEIKEKGRKVYHALSSSPIIFQPRKSPQLHSLSFALIKHKEQKVYQKCTKRMVSPLPVFLQARIIITSAIMTNL
ncbi:hypothetical protein NC651_004376 [Populus alba x Populus x berolinensis]|nr:hypothetical protein NC651_004376 [Populus alba x Populus x berolinensis]